MILCESFSSLRPKLHVDSKMSHDVLEMLLTLCLEGHYKALQVFCLKSKITLAWLQELAGWHLENVLPQDCSVLYEADASSVLTAS